MLTDNFMDDEERNGGAKIALRAVGFLIIFSIFGGIAYYFYLEKTKPPVERNHADGCITYHPDNVGIPRRTAILIDATTPIDPQMAKAVIPQVSVFVDRLSMPEERFALFSVSDRNYRSIFEEAGFCRPKNERNERGLTDQPEKIRRRWEKFSENLAEVFHTLATGKGSKFSPILETIDAVMEEDSNGNIFDRIVIFSDMMAHMPSHSFTHYGANLPNPSETHDYLDPTGGALTGKTVIVCYVVRPDDSPEFAYQGQEHRDWWKRYFESKGVSEVQIGQIRRSPSTGKYSAQCL